MMLRYVAVSGASGILFGILDGLIYANPLAQRLYGVFRPIARERVNAPAGVLIDVVYGFAMAAMFLVVHRSLPGETGLWKGLSFGVGAWFFRCVMPALGQWVMFRVPAATLWYMVVTGLLEMLVIGAVYGLALGPVPRAE